MADTTGAGDAFTAGFTYKLLQVRLLGQPAAPCLPSVCGCLARPGHGGAGFTCVAQAGSLDALAAEPRKLKESIVFASATGEPPDPEHRGVTALCAHGNAHVCRLDAGALTCTKKGAIGSQPTQQEVEALFETSKDWYNFWQ